MAQQAEEKQDEATELTPNYATFEKMQAEAMALMPVQDGSQFAGVAPDQIAAVVQKFQQQMAEYTKKFNEANAYQTQLPHLDREWNKQWQQETKTNEDGSESTVSKAGNADSDYMLKNLNNPDVVNKWNKQRMGFMMELNQYRTVGGSMEKFVKVRQKQRDLDVNYYNNALKQMNAWNPKRMYWIDIKLDSIASNEMQLKIAENSYEIDVLVAEKVIRAMEMSDEERAANDAKFAELQAAQDKLQKDYKDNRMSQENMAPVRNAWKAYKDCIEKHPLKMSLDISVKMYENAAQTAGELVGYDEHMRVMREVNQLLQDCIASKEKKIHPYAIYVVADHVFASESNSGSKTPHQDRAKLCATIYQDLSNFLDKMAQGGHLSKKEKTYAKFLLVWKWRGPVWDGGRDYYHLLMKKATQVMNKLRVPLDEEYAKLEKKDSVVIKLKLADGVKCDSKIKSQRDLLAFAWSEWFEDEDVKLTDEQLDLIKKNYKEWGFSYFGPATDKSDNFDFDKEIGPFLQSLEEVTTTSKLRYLASDTIALDIINQVAYKVNEIFQPKMQKLFEMNRKKMGYPLDSDDIKNGAVGVFAGPIKTKARQMVKCETDYKDDPVPRSGSVLDDVRCAIVVQDDVELASLFQLIVQDDDIGYKGKVYRAKNAFSDVKKNSFGYRAVLMNVIETYTTRVNGKLIEFPLIVEIQLILKSYFEIRKSMHLAYSIVRAEDPNQLSKDACKVGVLEI